MTELANERLVEHTLDVDSKGLFDKTRPSTTGENTGYDRRCSASVIALNLERQIPSSGFR